MPSSCPEREIVAKTKLQSFKSPEFPTRDSRSRCRRIKICMVGRSGYQEPITSVPRQPHWTACNRETRLQVIFEFCQDSNTRRLLVDRHICHQPHLGHQVSLRMLKDRKRMLKWLECEQGTFPSTLQLLIDSVIVLMRVVDSTSPEFNSPTPR